MKSYSNFFSKKSLPFLPKVMFMPHSSAASPHSLGSCTFEDFRYTNPTCGWINTIDQFKWTRANKATLSLNTGPSFDHTYGTDKGD